MDALPELWNVDHLAEYLDATKSFVYRLTREHRIRYIKFGKELRFRPDDVAAHLEAESVPISGPVAARAVAGRATGTEWRREPPTGAAARRSASRLAERDGDVRGQLARCRRSSTRLVAMNTKSRDERIWRNQIEPTFGGMRLGDLRRSAIAAWVAELSGGLAPATVVWALAVLRKMLDDAARAPRGAEPARSRLQSVAAGHAAGRLATASLAA